MKIAVLTLGCRTNQAESAEIERMISEKGHLTSDLAGNPDLCIINTCSVTAKADYQSRQLISKALKTGAEVIVTGCYSELNKTTLKFKENNVKVIENSNKSNIINLIPSNSSSSALSNAISRHRPVIKVQDGCNNACTYCIIPRARGRSRSIALDKVINEIQYWEVQGVSEVVLSGIHLGMYGRDLSDDLNLAQLLKAILDKTSLLRIRLSSIEINEISLELLEIMRSDRICKHLHLPLQSGDEVILKSMNRTYDLQTYVEMHDRIRQKFDNIAIGTDVIVGFPGEGEQEFINTTEAIENLDFSYIHVFPYSIRPGTKAATMANQVNDRIKKRRVSELRAIGRQKKAAFIKKNKGIEHEIVVEAASESGVTGTTSNYIRVHIPTRMSVSAGKLVRVGITGVENEMALGFPIIDSQGSDK